MPKFGARELVIGATCSLWKGDYGAAVDLRRGARVHSVYVVNINIINIINSD